MSEGKFQLYKTHKMMDYLEGQVTEYAHERITEWFGVENVEDLTKEQILEVIEYSEDEYLDSFISLGLRNAVNTWENEHEEYLL